MAGKMAQRKQNKYTQNQQGDNGLGVALCLLLFQSAERYGLGFSQSNDRTERRAPTPDIILNTNPAPQLFAGFGFKASGVLKILILIFHKKAWYSFTTILSLSDTKLLFLNLIFFHLDSVEGAIKLGWRIAPSFFKFSLINVYVKVIAARILRAFF